MQAPRQEPIIIELDDPSPRWFRWAAILGTLVIVALILLPWVIDVEESAEAETNQTQTVQSTGYAPVCQPTLDIPSFAEPAASVALPSWMRICDWFIEPGERPTALPTQPVIAPRLTDD